MGNRRHSKVSRMPRDVRDVFYQKVGEGHTIQEITDWLRQLGQDISRAAVGREVKDFVGQLNRFKAVKEQAKAIVSEAGGDGLNLEEAAVTVALNNIMEYLMDPVLSNMQQEEASKVMMALARLQSSSVQREKLKMDFKDKLAKEAEAIGKMAKAEGLSDELADAIKKKILGIAA